MLCEEGMQHVGRIIPVGLEPLHQDGVAFAEPVLMLDAGEVLVQFQRGPDAEVR